MASLTDHPLFRTLPPLAEDLWQALRASGITSGAAVDVINTLLRSAAPADLEGHLVLAPPHGAGPDPQTPTDR